MRKNTLIRLLEGIPGNPNILLWNGFVEDWMDIDKEFVPVQMGKESLEFRYNAILHEKLEFGAELTEELKESAMSRAKELHKKSSSDILNPYVEDIEIKEWYGSSVRTAYLINAKSRGIHSFDKAGSINY